MDKSDLPYDPADKQSILCYAEKLVGTTLRDHIEPTSIANPQKRKGSFGNAVEEYYFCYKLNSNSNPDFEEVGMELKTTPLKQDKQGNYKAKERLVITMINYSELIAETFETSNLKHKAKDILLISYVYEKDKDPLDYKIAVVAEWGLPQEDMDVFKSDWQLIYDKVKAGKAHEISGSDTLYLEACTKAANGAVRTGQPCSNIEAKPRAWALKSSYMTAVQNKLLENMEPITRTKDEEDLSLLELVKLRFSHYFGMNEDELGQKFGYKTEQGKKPKNLTALITNQILGVNPESKIEQFEKAGIKPKTIRLKKNGTPKESVSFPRFDYYNLAQTCFEESDFYSYLQQKYLFVLYKESPDNPDVYQLQDVVFWQMPDSDLDEAKRCYEEMQKRVLEGRAEDSVKTTENRCCHVRPHARNKKDTLPAPPDNKQVIKKCFWLNQKYLAEEISRITQKS